jgi:hypothetical protein
MVKSILVSSFAFKGNILKTASSHKCLARKTHLCLVSPLSFPFLKLIFFIVYIVY